MLQIWTKRIVYLAVATGIVAPMTNVFAADNNLYLDLQVFQSKDKSLSGTYPGISINNSDTGYGIGLGYKLNENFAIEGGYKDFGKVSATGSTSGVLYGNAFTLNGNITEKADGIYLGTAISVPFTSQLAGVVRVGLLSWDGKANATGTLTYAGTTYSGSASTSDSGTDPYFGLGLNCKITDSVSTGLDWTRYRVGGDNIDSFGLRLKYYF